MASNKYYKEVNELLRFFDSEIQKVKEGKNNSPSNEFGISFKDNKIGINRENIDNILATLHKNKIISGERITDAGVVFSSMGVNSIIIREIKHHYNFDIKPYIKSIREPILIAKRSNCIAIASLIVAIIAIIVSVLEENPFDKRIDNLKNKLDSLISKSTNKADILYKKTQPQTRKK